MELGRPVQLPALSPKWFEGNNANGLGASTPSPLLRCRRGDYWLL
jgi:hypothetical protein